MTSIHSFGTPVANRDAFLLFLNHIYVNQNHTQYDNDLIANIISHYCSDEDKYVKHICGKIIIKCVSKQIIELHAIDGWHCVSQMCGLLTDLLPQISVAINYEAIIGVISAQLDALGKGVSGRCDVHCMCQIMTALNLIYAKTSDQTLNQIITSFTTYLDNSDNREKRCVYHSLLNLLWSVSNQNNVCLHSSAVLSISEWISKQLTTDCIPIANTYITFGGICFDKDYDCDVILIRKLVLIYLSSLSSTANQTNRSDISLQLQTIFNYVKKKWDKISENNYIIDLMIDEDNELISALNCIIKLDNTPDNELSHNYLNAFINAIHSDSSVLLDMLCSDDETAVSLLRLLLSYLKLNHINLHINQSVRQVLLELRNKVQRLTSKKLFPYEAKPLLKLLNQLEN